MGYVAITALAFFATQRAAGFGYFVETADCASECPDGYTYCESSTGEGLISNFCDRDDDCYGDSGLCEGMENGEPCIVLTSCYTLSGTCPSTCYGMSCDERFIAESDSTCDEQESWGCDCSGCECDGCASEVVLYEGATSGYGADLDVIVDQGVWDAGYTLALSFTMPDDLSAIGDWDGLLGNDDGGHPYPYFNQDGLWFEIQNGPHPNEGGLSLDRFTRGESYTVIIEHWMYDGTHCFRMYIDGTDASFDGTDASEWCYDYTYSSTPLYAGCGYDKESETFAGSVTRITLDTHSCDDNSTVAAKR